MPKFQYEVTLPSGEKYLTTTLAEARALEAKASKRPHGRPVDRSKLVQNSSAPMSRKDRMKPAINDGYKKPSQAWVREILQNSFDNFADKVIFEFGENDALAMDDGSGMDRNLLLNKFLVPGMSAKPAGSVGGFGEAKKLLTFPWDQYAIVTLVKGGKVQVATGIGNNWDYWEDGQCYDVTYNEDDEPKAVEVTPTKPNAKYLPYKEIEGLVKRLKKQGHGTATYIRGTNGLTAYLAEIGSVKALSGNKGLPSPADAIGYVAYCELPGKTVRIDGTDYLPNVQIPSDAQMMPPARVYPGLKLYYVEPDKAGDLSGMTIVRAKSKRGTQVMWTEQGVTAGTLFIEIEGDTKWLLNNTRDSFEYYTNEWWNKFKSAFAKDVGSMFLDLSMDLEFDGNKQATFASQYDLDEKIQKNRSKAAQARYEYEERMRYGDKKEAAQELAKAIEEGVAEDDAPPEAPRTPSENTKDMLTDAKEAADVQGVAELAMWTPPLRVMSNFANWRVPEKYMPATMEPNEIRLLRAWTEALRRVLALLGAYNHRFSVGFVFTDKVLALTTSSKTLSGVVCYLVNPFVSRNELRSDKLFRPVSSVSLIPGSSGVIDLDVNDDAHLSVLVSRAVHEIVHGVYGVSGHDEDFSSTITMLFAQIGDQYSKVIKAARAGAKAPVPKRKAPGKAPGKAGPGEDVAFRKTPAKVSKTEEGLDPRLPPAGTVLRRDDLTVVIGFAGEILALNRGVYSSLSKAVAQYLNQGTYNGYRWFDLLEPKAERGSRYYQGKVNVSRLWEIAQDIRDGRRDMSWLDYR